MLFSKSERLYVLVKRVTEGRIYFCSVAILLILEPIGTNSESIS